MIKSCSECGTEFSTSSAHKYTCSRACYKKHWEKYRRSDEGKAKRERWKLSDGRYAQLKSRIKQKGFSVTLSKEDYFKIVQEDCYYCGKTHWGVEKGVGLDRLDSKGEYTKDNVVSCCGDCNRSKSNIHAPGEFKKMMSGDIEDKYLKALELINKKQKVERTLDEFVDYVLEKFSD